MAAKTYRRIAAAKTTLKVLLALSEYKEACSAARLAERLNLPAGTVLCHLATLEDEGFVRAVGDCWIPGMALAKIWARVKSAEEAKILEAQRNLAELEIK